MELIDIKLGGVHSTDSRLLPFKAIIQCLIWALACLLFGKILNLERIDRQLTTAFQILPSVYDMDSGLLIM